VARYYDAENQYQALFFCYISTALSFFSNQKYKFPPISTYVRKGHLRKRTSDTISMSAPPSSDNHTGTERGRSSRIPLLFPKRSCSKSVRPKRASSVSTMSIKSFDLNEQSCHDTNGNLSPSFSGSSDNSRQKEKRRALPSHKIKVISRHSNVVPTLNSASPAKIRMKTLTKRFEF
jgi:hypothetical protein